MPRRSELESIPQFVVHPTNRPGCHADTSIFVTKHIAARPLRPEHNFDYFYFFGQVFAFLPSSDYHPHMGPAQLSERIESVDTATAGMAQLTSLLGDLNRIDGWVSVKKADIARRLAELEADGSAPPATDVLARSNHSSARQAAKDKRRADAYGKAPALGKQRAAGRVSDEHADALANAAKNLDDEQQEALFAHGDALAKQAAASTPDQFARHLRKLTDALSSDDEATDRSEQQRGNARLTHGLNTETGMGWIRAELHPDDYQKFKAKLDAETAAVRKLGEYEGLSYDQVAAIAFMTLITSTRAAARPVPEVIVLIDLTTLQNGTHAESTCEYGDGTPVPTATARRHACNADIIPVVLDGDGQPLDVGRAKRHATKAQRAALRSMYRTCAVDGCETSFDRTEMHHLLEWDQHNGSTDLENLVPICTYHHHRAHEGRWRLKLDPSTRELSVFLPDGTLHSRCQPDLLTERHNTAA